MATRLDCISTVGIPCNPAFAEDSGIGIQDSGTDCERRVARSSRSAGRGDAVVMLHVTPSAVRGRQRRDGNRPLNLRTTAIRRMHRRRMIIRGVDFATRRRVCWPADSHHPTGLRFDRETVHVSRLLSITAGHCCCRNRVQSCPGRCRRRRPAAR